MDLRKIAGFALGLLGTFLMWQTGVLLAQYYHANGLSRISELLFDPQYSLRLISAMAAFLAGLAALTERQGGAWLAGIASALLGVQSLAILGGHGYISAWQREAVYLILLTGLFLTIVATEKKAPEQTEA